MDTLLSLISMYSWDSTILDNLVIPAEMDKDLFTDNLLLELGELELLYNDPNFMKFAIGKWSLKELDKWQKLYNTTVLEYNPIENYNRTDTFTDTETRDLNVSSLETRDLNGSNLETRDLDATENQTKNLAGTNLETRDLAGTGLETRDLAGTGLETRDLTTTVDGDTLTTDTDETGGGDTTTKFVQGYNGLSETQAEKQVTALGSTNTKTVGTDTTQTGTDTGTVANATTDTGTVANATTDTGTVAQASTETGTDNKAMTDTGTVSNASTDAGTVSNNIDDTGIVSNEKVGNSKGNIGVTTTQQMIEQERKILEFNVYDYIIQSFKNRFCIMIY